MGKPFGGVWFQYQDTYGNNVDPGPALQAKKFKSGDDEIWWYPLGPGDVNSLTAISFKVMLASDSPTIAMKNVKYLDLYADDSRDALFDDDEILDFTGSLGGKKTPLYFLYDIETAENQSDDDEGNSSVSTGKRDKGPSQYGVWFKFQDTYGNNVDPGSWFHPGKFKSGDDEVWWYELSPDQVNSLTAISFKILLARQGDGGVAMKDIKYLDIYADDTKNVLLDGDEILNFTGSLGGKKTRPLYLLYDIQTAENPSDDEGEGNKDESGDEKSGSDDTNFSDEDDSDRPNPNYTLRLQATRSNARIREYMSMNVGDYSYTDGVLHAMPNAMPGLEYYLAEKRNRRGKVIDSGWVDNRFARLVYGD